MKGGPFGQSLPWRDLALGGFSIVSKKWTDQCEDCSLKKKSHCYSRAFFLKRKTRRLKIEKVHGFKLPPNVPGIFQTDNNINTEQNAHYAPGYFPPSIENGNRKFTSCLVKRNLFRI